MIRLDRSRFSDAVEALSAAFRDYPVMRYILSDAGEAYDTKLPLLVGYFTEARFARGYPVLGVERPGDGRLAAVANINPPRPVPTPAALEECFERLRDELGLAAIDRFQDFADAGTTLNPEEPHYYLGMLGVIPEEQSRGYGRRLLETLHEMSDNDPDSTGVSLTTEREKNVGLYEHFGYRVLGSALTKDGRLESWTMFRPDRP